MAGAAAGGLAVAGNASTAAVGALGSDPPRSTSLRGCTDPVLSPKDASHSDQEHGKCSLP